MDVLYYCEKCGRRLRTSPPNQLMENPRCDCCRHILFVIPNEYLDDISRVCFKKELEQQFLEEYVLSSPEFDPYFFEHREEILAEIRSRCTISSSVKKVTCSYCGSTNVTKIGTLDRTLSVSLWGKGSSKIGKQFHCNHCKANF